jgi:predicted GNAT family acetyltransferase
MTETHWRGYSEDPRIALDAAGQYLRARPVEHNVLLGLLEDRIAVPVAGRYWWVEREGQVVAFAFQSPITFLAGITASDRQAAAALAEAVAATEPGIPALVGEAGAAATFAGWYATLRKTPVTPLEGQRLYRLGTLVPPTGVAGSLRLATAEDEPLVVAWSVEFVRDIGGENSEDAAQSAKRRLAEGRVWIWEDGSPVSVAMVPATVERVSRVGFVYTPPEHRRRGYAAALTAAVSERCLAAGADTCVLFTQLSNPTSNAIYQRIGYEAVQEAVAYRIGG